jgi:AvrPphF-ORF-2
MGCVGSTQRSPRSSHTALGRTGSFESNQLRGTDFSQAGGTPQHEAPLPRSPVATTASSSGTSGIAPRAALPSSSSGNPGAIGLQGDSYVLRKGKSFPSVNSLPAAARAAFLQKHDPINQLHLNDNSVFYRVTERERIVDGALTGHPQAGARIRNHLTLAENPYMKGAFMPAEMNAMDLPDPVLNVMHGPDAYEGAMNYATSEDRVAVMMTLGQLRAAGGGDVFLDVSARYGQDEASRALIVTLPKGAAVPVKVLD